jgi:hypothetical protein
MTSPDSTRSSTMGTQPAETSRNCDPAINGHRETQLALYWSGRQVAETIGYTDEYLDYAVLMDERVTATSCSELRAAWRELCGADLNPQVTWNEMPVFPACVARRLTETTLTRAEVNGIGRGCGRCSTLIRCR